MTNFEDDVKAGNIYRKKVCSRCGNVDYELFTGYTGRNWEERPTYDGHGYGSVVIVPYCEGLSRMEFTLCPLCALLFKGTIKNFMIYREEKE